MGENRAIVHPLQLGSGSVRVAVKDCIDIAGLPTTGGSKALADAPAALRHAVVVQYLLDGLCRIVGKANMHELAFGVTGVNHWMGTPLNPKFPDRVPGGSSSGSASAVAAGLVDFAVGTDTGGSIRTPAACCGVVGLKPSFARISREGAHPARSSLDVIGPIASTMDMIEVAMAVMAPGYRRHDDYRPRLARVRVSAIDADVATAFDDTVAAWGGADGEVELPLLELAYKANIAIIAAETYAAFGHLVDSGAIGADVQARLEAASAIKVDQLAEAEDIRRRFRDEVDAALEGFDALLLPTMPCFPLRLDEAGDAPAALRMTALVRPFNLSGHPALTIPVHARGGLPIGVQFVGRIGQDERLCAAGRMFANKVSVISCAGEEA